MTDSGAEYENGLLQGAIDALPAGVALTLTFYSSVIAGDWIMLAGSFFFMIVSLDWAVNREAIRTTAQRLQEVADE